MFDLISGHVQLAFPPIAQVIEYIRDGRLHALAVTTPVRSNALPDVPSVKEFVPGYEAIGWYGICAPRGTPAEIIEKLNREITAGVADPNIKARLVDLGIEPSPMTSAEFGRFIDSEIEKWGNVVKFAGIKAE
jgi:tripartite-type tricarboxylate transporter receptor subunit TctC